MSLQSTLASLDTFTRQYIETALWSSTDDCDEPLDANFGVEDFAPEALAKIKEDCADFQQSFGHFVDADLSRAGHDFWLTRNHHGAGFWDGNWQEAYSRPDDDTDDFHPTTGSYPTVGAYLTAMSHPYGECTICVGDDGKLYLA